ncbi:MAG: hypothetical protein B7Y51_08700 [Burkholderiales bacterium 28-67-8]|nr:MAG: hypothetical protein B7Y51_08700 [Burkholderiales bacterium 28-67-8]
MLKKVLAAASLACCALGAQATITIVAGNNVGPFIDLSTLTTSPIYTASVSGLRLDPPGAVDGKYLAAGFPRASNLSPVDDPVIVNFAQSTFASFLWGSPDTYNFLTIHTDGASDGLVFDSTNTDLINLGFIFNGWNSHSHYVGFQATNELITGFEFYSDQYNAFEVTNFSTSPIPEPETYALMLAGLGVVGFMARRRKAV